MAALRHSDRLLIILLAVLIIIIIGIFLAEQVFGVKKDVSESRTIMGEAFKRLQEKEETKTTPEPSANSLKLVPDKFFPALTQSLFYFLD
ncbi:MAG: hypothetical protein ABIE23_04880 [archaeon]